MNIFQFLDKYRDIIKDLPQAFKDDLGHMAMYYFENGKMIREQENKDERTNQINKR